MKNWSDEKFWGVVLTAMMAAALMIGTVVELLGVAGAALCAWYIWAFIVFVPFAFFEDAWIDKMRACIEKLAKKESP